MLRIYKKPQITEGDKANRAPYLELITAAKPVILKGVTNRWGLTRAGRKSNQGAINCFYQGPLKFPAAGQNISMVGFVRYPRFYEDARGELAPFNDIEARKQRVFLLNRLNR